jgi:hypothetical protein
MATQLWYNYASVMAKENNPDLYDKTIDTYLMRTNAVPLQGERFFAFDTADNVTKKVMQVSDTIGLPIKRTDTDPVYFDQPDSGYSKEITINTYRNALRVTKTLERIDRSGKIGRMMSGLMKSGQRLKEYAFANVVNTGTSTAGADGSYVFGNDHYQPGAGGGTWSNLETAAALTTTTFNTARTNQRKRKDSRGQVAPVMTKLLLVPADLEEKAHQIAGSDKYPETSTNAINPWKGTDILVWDYLTSTTGWGVWGDLDQDMWGLHYCVLSQPVVQRLAYPSADYPNISAGWELYMQMGVAASVVYNMSWNAGA